MATWLPGSHVLAMSLFFCTLHQRQHIAFVSNDSCMLSAGCFATKILLSGFAAFGRSPTQGGISLLVISLLLLLLSSYEPRIRAKVKLLSRLGMDPRFAASRDDLYNVQMEVKQLQVTQHSHAERLMRVEKRLAEDAAVKSVWATPQFPSALSGTPQHGAYTHPFRVISLYLRGFLHPQTARV